MIMLLAGATLHTADPRLTRIRVIRQGWSDNRDCSASFIIVCIDCTHGLMANHAHAVKDGDAHFAHTAVLVHPSICR